MARLYAPVGASVVPRFSMSRCSQGTPSPARYSATCSSVAALGNGGASVVTSPVAGVVGGMLGGVVGDVGAGTVDDGVVGVVAVVVLLPQAATSSPATTAW